jgi:hypothetical protein
MPAQLNVWDTEAEGKGKGAFVKMFSLNAHAAVKHDPDRYSFEKPEHRPVAPPVPVVPAPEPTPEPAALTVVEPDPLDHDEDGRKGGSKPKRKKS